MDFDLIDTVFSTIRSNPVLAGGAPRDYVCGKSVSDYDFYVQPYINSGDLEADITKLKGSLGLRESDISWIKPDGMYSESVLQVGDDIQLIFFPNPSIDALFDTFDIGLCKIAIDSSGKLYDTEAFRNDRNNKTLTCSVTEYNIQTHKSMLRHLHKVHCKYPDYKVNVQWRVMPVGPRIATPVEYHPFFEQTPIPF